MSAPGITINDPRAVPTTVRGRIGAYVALTKPRIIELLLVTTLPAMILAERSWPGTWLVMATLIGGTMSAGGANAINNVIDRDIDQIMRRTAHRPMATHKVPPMHALIFGIVLGLGGFAWLWVTANLLAAILSTAALLFYVFVYTLWLKRSSSQNIVIGGAAGAVPVLVGWAAVTGSLSVAPWVLFAIIFCLDSAALLGALTSVSGGLRPGRHPDAPGCGRRGSDPPEHLPLQHSAGGAQPGSLPGR